MSLEIDLQRPRYEVERIAGGWRIRDPRGTVLPSIFLDHQLAMTRRDHLQAEADRKAKRGRRPCMCCGNTFDSAGIHNRLCKSCRSRSDGNWMSAGGATSTGKVRRAASQP